MKKLVINGSFGLALAVLAVLAPVSASRQLAPIPQCTFGRSVSSMCADMDIGCSGSGDCVTCQNGGPWTDLVLECQNILHGTGCTDLSPTGINCRNCGDKYIGECVLIGASWVCGSQTDLGQDCIGACDMCL